MDSNYYDPDDINSDAQEKAEELESEGNAFADQREIRDLSKAIADEKVRKKSDQDDR